MKVNTKYHGVKEYKEEDIITFRRGLPGFEELKHFILFKLEENELFSILHSVENENTGLVVVSPFDVLKDYQLELSEEVIKELKIENEQEVLVVNTVTLSSKVENITVNLKAPVIINIKARLGEQIILDKDEYKIKHPLIGE
jgi:flagellar assembly factor FliW